MAAASSASARGPGIKNTVRLTVRDRNGGTSITRETVIRKVLMECCGFMPNVINCVQDFAGFFDVTFRQAAGWQKLYQQLQLKGTEAPLSLLKAQALFTTATQQERTIMLQMFNLYVPVVDVLPFLARYVESVGTPADVKDGLGIWTSKQQVKVKLRLDSNGGVIQPPSVFASRGNRGYTVYAGQSRVCRNCGKAGHIAAHCRVLMCKNCKTEGHLTKDCTQAKSCNLCGQAGNLYRDYPRHGGTYAQATREGAGTERAQAVSDVPASAADEAPDRTDDETREEGASTPRPATPLQTPQDQANDKQESMEEGRAEVETEWKVVKRKKTQKAAAK
ncbi:zinc finger CCHC domain-containing protein 3-like [Mobula hypostoma]|uniref:zinc finger CCHC domain-containing protein 3-like n=1 Tax=Mobula hypostoma TaxID=723540 RepID=UPI002FC37C0F